MATEYKAEYLFWSVVLESVGLIMSFSSSHKWSSSKVV